MGGKKNDIVYFCQDRRKTKSFEHHQTVTMVLSHCLLLMHWTIQIPSHLPKDCFYRRFFRHCYSLKTPNQNLISLLILLIKISSCLACINPIHPHSSLLPPLWIAFPLSEQRLGISSTFLSSTAAAAALSSSQRMGGNQNKVICSTWAKVHQNLILQKPQI